MQIKRTQILDFYKKRDLLKNLTGVKFGYALNRNLEVISQEIKRIQEIASQSSPEYKKYEEERIKICEQFAKKDAKGKSVLENNIYIFENKEEAEKTLNDFKEKNKEVVEIESKRIHELENDFLNEETGISIYPIKMEWIPESISVEQMALIDFLIEE